MPFKGKSNIKKPSTSIAQSKSGTQRPQSIPKPQKYKGGKR